MAKNFRGSARRISVVASGAIVAGRVYVVNQIFGVALTPAAAGQTYQLAIGGEWELPKAASVTPAVGALVYWDATNNNVTTTATGNTKIGVAVRQPAANDPTVLVRLNDNSL